MANYKEQTFNEDNTFEETTLQLNLQEILRLAEVEDFCRRQHWGMEAALEPDVTYWTASSGSSLCLTAGRSMKQQMASSALQRYRRPFRPARRIPSSATRLAELQRGI